MIYWIHVKLTALDLEMSFPRQIEHNSYCEIYLHS